MVGKKWQCGKGAPGGPISRIGGCIVNDFDDRMLANMDVVLDEICRDSRMAAITRAASSSQSSSCRPRATARPRSASWPMSTGARWCNCRTARNRPEKRGANRNRAIALITLVLRIHSSGSATTPGHCPWSNWQGDKVRGHTELGKPVGWAKVRSAVPTIYR